MERLSTNNKNINECQTITIDVKCDKIIKIFSEHTNQKYDIGTKIEDS
jgi:hypothetical protein